MNIPLLIAQAARGGGDLTMPRIIFWILLILWGIGSFGWQDNPAVVRGSTVVQVILFAVLGYYLFSF